MTARNDGPDGHRRRLGPDVQPLAADRTAPGQGREARSLHRDGAGEPAAGAPTRCGGLAARIPRHLRDRAAQPGAPDPLRDPQRTPRRRRRAFLRALARPRGRDAGRPGPVLLGRHPPAGLRLRRPGLQPLGRARLHEPPRTASTWPACRCAASSGARTTRSCVAGGHCTFNPEPLADFVDVFVIGDGEEPVGEITEVVAAFERGGRVGGREALLHDLATIAGRVRPVDVRRRLRRRVHPRGATPRTRTFPSGSRSARSRTSPSGRTRSSSSSRSSRWSTTG